MILNCVSRSHMAFTLFRRWLCFGDLKMEWKKVPFETELALNRFVVPTNCAYEAWNETKRNDVKWNICLVHIQTHRRQRRRPRRWQKRHKKSIQYRADGRFLNRNVKAVLSMRRWHRRFERPKVLGKCETFIWFLCVARNCASQSIDLEIDDEIDHSLSRASHETGEAQCTCEHRMKLNSISLQRTQPR